MELSESSSEKSSESKENDQVEQLFESIIEKKEKSNDKDEEADQENKEAEKNQQKTKAQQLEEIKKKSQGKKNQPSYLELFENFIYNDSLWINQHNQGKQKYTLLEDIALIYFIGADSINIENLDNDQLGPSFFKHLKRAGFFTDRTIESLRDRYRKYLSCLTSKDIVKIGSWLLENGVEQSFLEFKFNNDVKQKQLWKIVKYKQEENNNKETQLPQLSSINIKRKIEDFNRFTIERKLDKKVKLDIEDLLKANKQKIWQAGPFWMFLKQEDEWKVSNAKRPLTITTNFNGQRMIFLDTAKEDSQILWSDENDQILAQVKSYNDPSFRLLIKSKGIERVRNRIQYKKFWLPIQDENLRTYSGVVDKIDNMEELNKSNKLSIYEDQRADRKVQQLKADATSTIGEEQTQPPIESQVYLTSQEKCLEVPVCSRCADQRSCLTEGSVDQACYQYCLNNPAEASPDIVFLQKKL